MVILVRDEGLPRLDTHNNVAILVRNIQVLLPKASCPWLLLLTPSVVPTLDAGGANTTTLALALHGPWRRAKPGPVALPWAARMATLGPVVYEIR